MAVEIRPLGEGDISRLPALYKDVFQKEIPSPFWKWKYFENPAGNHLMWVAIDPEKDDRLIGQIGTIPVRMLAGGEVMLGAQTCDIAILSEYQKGGPFFKLHEQSSRDNRERGVQIIFGYSVPRTLKISTRLLKFGPVAPIRRLVKVLDPVPFLRRKLGPAGNAVGMIARKAVRWKASGRLRPAAGEEIVEVRSFDSRYEEVARSWNAKDRIMVHRDARYLDWRYLRHPTGSYRIYALEFRGEILGWTVIALEEGELRRAHLLELIARRNMTRAMELLLVRAIRYCIEAGAVTVGAWSFEHSPSWPVFRKRGFAVQETAHHLIARPHFGDPAPVDVHAAGFWEISMGDSDYH